MHAYSLVCVSLIASSGLWEHLLRGYESYYRTIGAVVNGSINCVGMNHITELLLQWSMGAFAVWV
jgi:hypothetical protein